MGFISDENGLENFGPSCLCFCVKTQCLMEIVAMFYQIAIEKKKHCFSRFLFLSYASE